MSWQDEQSYKGKEVIIVSTYICNRKSTFTVHNPHNFFSLLSSIGVPKGTRNSQGLCVDDPILLSLLSMSLH